MGISGWRYKPWRGIFYPADLPQKNELAYASRSFRSIEINGTFYSMQRPSSFEDWAEQTPDDFLFALKGSRYITHMLRLKNVKTALANFFASGILRLGEKLGPILWQLPPNFPFNSQRLQRFFDLLPRDSRAAGALARRHERWMKGRAATRPRTDGPLRHALVVRHKTFECAEFIELLRANEVALVCADSVEWPRMMDLTADFAYCRLHGSEVLYASGYDAASLDRWACIAKAWSCGEQAREARTICRKPVPRGPRNVFVYFDNDAKVRAPFDAQELAKRVQANVPATTAP